MHREQFDNRQLSRLDEDQYSHLAPNGQVMAWMKELASLYGEY